VICEKLIKKYNKTKTGQDSRQESIREIEFAYKITV
jgi:hypothetical protein